MTVLPPHLSTKLRHATRARPGAAAVECAARPTVVCFGDSLTEFGGWVLELSEYFRRKADVVNRCIPMATNAF